MNDPFKIGGPAKLVDEQRVHACRETAECHRWRRAGHFNNDRHHLCGHCWGYLAIGQAAETDYREMGLARDLALWLSFESRWDYHASWCVRWWAGRSDLP